MIIIIIKEKSGSATITTHSQPPMPRGREKGQKISTCKIYIYIFYFYFVFPYFFQHIKMSKAFTPEKSQNKNVFCSWHVRLFILLFMAQAELVYSLFRTPTLPYRAQPLLYATGKMSLNWGLDCSFTCSMHALVVNCLPSF